MGKTRGVHETTPELRNRMVGMYEAGLGLREIAAAVNCSQRTVKRWLNRFDREGNVDTRDRCGRKRATTTEQDDAIIQLATSTSITAAKAVLPALGLKCSVDTVRERLHKAGIHNWSPSRKHIQRIPLGDADGAALQQAVWRPTGTQLGKKKHSKAPERSKTPNTKAKKKKVGKKPKEPDGSHTEGSNDNILRNLHENIHETNNGGINSINNVNINDTTNQTSNLMVRASNHEKQQEMPSVMTFNTPQAIIHCSDLPPPPDMPQPFQNLPNQPEIYHQDLTPWPVDLNPQNQPQYLPNQSTIPPTSSHLQELYPQTNHLHHHQPLPPPPIDHSLALPQPVLPQTPLNQSTAPMSTSESSNSSFDSTQGQTEDFGSKTCRKTHETRQNSEMTSNNEATEECDDSGENLEESSEGNDSGKKKKGGKAKGTLETSVELRNRMIGMSQAGLSTLSIALAINRSERTVKRWLERWKKEGNVQTKERKGRRRITTKEQDEAIIAMATQNPLTAAKHVAPALGLQCSVDTIRERLHKAGIHSWKLGKKQGEGNAVHTVHLWQPSGNRPNRPRILKKTTPKRVAGKGAKGGEGKKKSAKKSVEKVVEGEVEQNRVELPPQAIEQQTMQFHDGSGIGYGTGGNVLQPVGILTPLNPTSGQQQVHLVAPVMRPDCRMATAQVSQGYSSCMVNGGGHIEQQDPLNYEPYIWNF